MHHLNASLEKGLVAMVACLLALSAAAVEAPRDPYQYFFDQHLGDFREELTTARDGGKKGILIMFEMDECPFCHYMKNNVLNQPRVQAYFKEHFLIFSVDVEGDVEVTDFQGNPTTMKDFAFKQYRVRATPVFAFFDLDGEYIKRARFTGRTNGADEFMLLGRYVVEGIYRDETFTKFKRRQRADG